VAVDQCALLEDQSALPEDQSAFLGEEQNELFEAVARCSVVDQLVCSVVEALDAEEGH